MRSSVLEVKLGGEGAPRGGGGGERERERERHKNPIFSLRQPHQQKQQQPKYLLMYADRKEINKTQRGAGSGMER